MGNEELDVVSINNTIAARTALLIMVCIIRGAFWCVLWSDLE